MKVGDRVRIPYIEGTGSGLTRYGTVEFIEGLFVRVRVAYGRRVRRVNYYTQRQLEAEAQAFREQRRRKAWLAAAERSQRKRANKAAGETHPGRKIRRRDLEAL